MFVTVCYLCEHEVTLIIPPLSRITASASRDECRALQAVNYKPLPGCNKGLKVLNDAIPEFITGKLVDMCFWLVCGVYNPPIPPVYITLILSKLF